MATVYFKGGAQNVNDVWTITPTIGSAGDKLQIKIANYTLSYTLPTSPVLADVCTAFASLWNNSLYSPGPHMDFVAEATATTVVVTSRTAGVPMGATPTDTSTGTTSASIAHTTTATGSEWWDNGENWVGGSAAAGGDTIYILRGAPSIRYGLPSSVLDACTLYVPQAYTGHIGLPAYRKLSSGAYYYEHRSRFLKIAGDLYVGTRGEVGAGSPLIKLDSVDKETSMICLNSSPNPAEPERYSVEWKGTHADNIVAVSGGQFGIFDTATVKQVFATAGIAYFGPLVTHGAGGITATSTAEVILNSEFTSLSVTKGATVRLLNGAQPDGAPDAFSFAFGPLVLTGAP